MTIYYVIGIMMGTVALVAIVGRVAVYLVRKNDKVRDMSDKMPTFGELDKRISDVEQRVQKVESSVAVQWTRIDENNSAIANTGLQIQENMKEVQESISLILKALSGMIEATIKGNSKESLEAVKSMIDESTMLVVRDGFARRIAADNLQS